MACSIFNSGSTAGSALSLPLVTWLIAMVGWRGAFVVTGLLGMVWALAWWFIYRDPERYRAVAPRAGGCAAGRSAARRPWRRQAISWFDLFRYRSVWGLMIGLFCLNFAIYFFITWFPSYLLQARGFSLARLGTLGSLPALMGVVGNWMGGYHLATACCGAGWSADRARARPAWSAACCWPRRIGLSAFVTSTWRVPGAVHPGLCQPVLHRRQHLDGGERDRAHARAMSPPSAASRISPATWRAS